MSDAYSLLNINQDVLRDFHLLANTVGDLQTERVINRNVRTLKSIEERLFVSDGIKVSKNSIDEILYKVVEASQSREPNAEEWTMRELRIVSYFIMKLQDDDKVFDYALTLLDKGWRNMYFNGLVFFLMNSWCLIRPDVRKKTSQLVIKKLNEYSDNNRRYVLLKNHANLFEEAGPLRLAMILTSQKKKIEDAPLVLGSKSAAISQSYFSDVIIKYCERNTMTEDELEELFEKHDVKRTKQLLFSDLVMKAEQNGDPMQQQQLSKFINRILGDITLTATWAPFLGATYEEAQKLKRAMQQVNYWFTRQIIETFFEVCVQDRDRKKFWLDYVKYVRGFKIVGSTTTKRQLQNDPRVNTMYHRHFIETNSTYSQTAALVLSIKDYVLIEFSDTGCAYAYKQQNSKVQFLRKGVRYMNSTNDLKDTSLDPLVERMDWGGYYHNEEGRVFHKGQWQSRLHMWMQRNILSQSNTGTSYFDTKDDDTFTAQELPKQEKIRKPIEIPEKSKVESPISKPVIKQQEARPKPQPQQRTLFHGVPEFDNQRSKPQLSKPQTAAQPIRPKVQSLPNAVYESNVSYALSSKWFFDGICRVVCNNKGYYVNVGRTRQFIKIGGLMGNDSAGSIWIKRPNLQGWVRIVHATLSGTEFLVGYIKQAGGGLLFKQDISQSSFMQIKTR